MYNLTIARGSEMPPRTPINMWLACNTRRHFHYHYLAAFIRRATTACNIVRVTQPPALPAPLPALYIYIYTYTRISTFSFLRTVNCL